MHIIPNKDLGPQVRLTAFNQIPSLLLEHRVVVGDANELVIAETLSISNVCEIRISSLAEFAHNQRFVELKNRG